MSLKSASLNISNELYIDPFNIKNLASCSTLTSLDASNNSLTDEAVKILALLPQLISLIVKNNLIRDIISLYEWNSNGLISFHKQLSRPSRPFNCQYSIKLVN